MFENGLPTRLIVPSKNLDLTDPLELFTKLNELAGENGVGRIDIVENRFFVGIKSRGVYETPAGTVLFAAHQDLEIITLDREVFRIQEELSRQFAQLIYNGFWFSPELEFLLNCFNHSQKEVTGVVRLSLYKGNVIVRGRKAENKLYDAELSSMDIEGGYDQADAEGFYSNQFNSLTSWGKLHRG